MVDNLSEQVLQLRDSALSMAGEVLTGGHLKAFEQLNHVVIDLTTIANQLSGGEVSHERPSNSNGSFTHRYPDPETTTILIFKAHKGVVYEAVLDLDRLQRVGHGGPCVYFGGQWTSASGSASSITGYPVNGWRHFWRYQGEEGREVPVEDIRGRRHRE